MLNVFPKHYEHHFCIGRRRHQGTIPPQGFLCPVCADRVDHRGGGQRAILPRSQHRGLREGFMHAAHLGFRAAHRDCDGGAANPRGARKPHDISVAGQAGHARTGHSRQISGLLAGERHRPGGLLHLFCGHHRVARAVLAGAELFAGLFAAIDHARHRDGDDAARLNPFFRAVGHDHHSFYRRCWYSVFRKPFKHDCAAQRGAGAQLHLHDLFHDSALGTF